MGLSKDNLTNKPPNSIEQEAKEVKMEFSSKNNVLGSQTSIESPKDEQESTVKPKIIDSQKMIAKLSLNQSMLRFFEEELNTAEYSSSFLLVITSSFGFFLMMTAQHVLLAGLGIWPLALMGALACLHLSLFGLSIWEIWTRKTKSVFVTITKMFQSFLMFIILSILLVKSSTILKKVSVIPSATQQDIWTAIFVGVFAEYLLLFLRLIQIVVVFFGREKKGTGVNP